MNKLNFQWKTKIGQYQSGEALYLNRIKVAEFEWNSTRSRDDDDENTRYRGLAILPSLLKVSQYGKDKATIKASIEKIVSDWFKEALR